MQTLSIEWWRPIPPGCYTPVAAAFRVNIKTEDEAKRVFEAMRGVLRALAPDGKQVDVFRP